MACFIHRSEGLSGMYNGLSAGIFRQMTYTMGRLGAYSILSDHFSPADGSPLPLHWKLLLASGSGAAGSVVGCPAEVCLIRMTADGRLPPAERRNYNHVFNALRRIVADEGACAQGGVYFLKICIIFGSSQLSGIFF
jgi:solute carrier family 25 oxoglutarate transporter 11